MITPFPHHPDMTEILFTVKGFLVRVFCIGITISKQCNPDPTPHDVASEPGLCYLYTSQQRVRLIRVKVN